MTFYQKQYIKNHELGLEFRNGDLHGVLKPGEHRLFPRLHKSTVEVFDRLSLKFWHDLLPILVKNETLKEHLDVISLSDTQRALVWQEGRLMYILGAGLHAFWKQDTPLNIEIYDIENFEFKHPQLKRILVSKQRNNVLESIQVPAHMKAVLVKDCKILKVLDPGVYAFWKMAGDFKVVEVDMRKQQLDVGGQEIMTSDKVTLRMNLLVSYKVIDPVVAGLEFQDVAQALYRTAQLALRSCVGTRKLDALLSDKESVGKEVQNALEERAGSFGLELFDVGVRDIILPGDMKHLLNQVTEAQKEAEANLIRRREETAAARSQANTARLLSENPTLIRMKEMEMIQEILSNNKTTIYLGSGNMKEQIRNMFFSDAQ